MCRKKSCILDNSVPGFVLSCFAVVGRQPRLPQYIRFRLIDQGCEIMGTANHAEFAAEVGLIEKEM